MVSKPAAVAVIFCIITAAVILSCTPQEQKNRETAREGSFNYTAYFCPAQDCLQAFAHQLKNAKASIRCALYGIDSKLLSDLASFSGSAAANVTLEIVVDKNAKIPAAYLKQAGGFVLKRSSKGIMHNKYCIIDNAEIITGSFNPTAAAKNDYNNIFIINSTSLASFYMQNFNLLKENLSRPHSSQQPPKAVMLNDTLVQVHFCPQDSCADAIGEELEKANTSILFAAYSFTSAEIANELILKSQSGVAVSGIIEKSTTGSAYSKDKAMAANGISLQLESTKKLMHHKFFVVDNKVVITGSFNPTQNADTRNDENIIIIENSAVAEAYAVEFNRILNDSAE